MTIEKINIETVYRQVLRTHSDECLLGFLNETSIVLHEKGFIDFKDYYDNIKSLINTQKDYFDFIESMKKLNKSIEFSNDNKLNDYLLEKMNDSIFCTINSKLLRYKNSFKALNIPFYDKYEQNPLDSLLVNPKFKEPFLKTNGL